jgi:hypothetical protein
MARKDFRMLDLLDKVPPAIKSLWHLENELRSALQNTILLRKGEASKHMGSAKAHLEQALKEIRGERSNAAATSATSSESGEKLDYGEGQREQYGEGSRYRSEELTEGADQSTAHGWAGGGADDVAPIPDTKPKS